MPDKPVRIPGPEHPIAIVPNPARVVVTLAGRVIADSTAALTLREASYPPVQYIPRQDVDQAVLVPSGTGSYCPYKGEATYFSLAAGDGRATDAAWSYEAPFDAVAVIRGHVAFYSDRVDAIEERAA